VHVPTCCGTQEAGSCPATIIIYYHGQLKKGGVVVDGPRAIRDHVWAGDAAALAELEATAVQQQQQQAAAPALSPRAKGFVTRLQGVTGDAGREAEALRLAMAAKEEAHAATLERERLAAQLAMQRDRALMAASLTADVEEALAVLARVRSLLQEKGWRLDFPHPFGFRPVSVAYRDNKI
jgi:hypothetical protein